MLNLVQLIPTCGPSAGGVGTVVRNLNLGFAEQSNYSSHVFDIGSRPKYAEIKNLKSFGKKLSEGMIKCCVGLIQEKPDITHLHGIWHPLSLSCLIAKRVRGHIHICSPHGMLAEWILSQNPRKKRLARILYENSHWNAVDCFHALTPMEAVEIAKVLPKRKQIAIIPNGVEVPASQPVRVANSKPYFLYLGRFHKKKGIEELLSAWVLKPFSNNYTLKIVGWGDMDCLKGELPAGVELIGPIDGDEKSELLRGAEYVILPSFSEGLPMVVLEAWAQGTPVIMTPYCNLSDSFKYGAAIEIEPAPESIARGLSLSIELGAVGREEMSRCAYSYCKENYSLKSMVDSFMALHRYLLNGEESSKLNFYAY